MIEVCRTNNGISIKGHAHYAEPGKDIVCAGVSTLVQNLIQSIEELTQDTIQYSMQPGKVEVIYNNLSSNAKILLEAFWLGIKKIAEAYPENVCISLTFQ